jgi:serine/threonine protein kinase
MTTAHSNLLTKENYTPKTKRFNFINDIEFKSDTHEYFIDIEKKVGLGGDAQLFEAKRKSDGEIFIARIMDKMVDDAKTRIHRGKIVTFLLSSKDYKTSNIIPLIDYGKCNTKDYSGNDHSFFVDILPYCELLRSNSKVRFGYKELRDVIIPQLVNALEYLHSNKIVHRDIKPENLYIYNEKLVLGDFGTAEFIVKNDFDDGDDFFVTQDERGTIGYMAPEIIGDGVGGFSVDLFSLGVTIASLYLGEETFKSMFPPEAPKTFYGKLKKDGLQLHASNNDMPLQWLVNGLVRKDPEDRMDLKSVKEWIKDPKKFENRVVTVPNNNSFSFDFENKTYNNYQSLAAAFTQNWEVAQGYLYRGIIKGRFISFNATIANAAHDIVEREPTSSNRNLGLAQLIYLLYPEGKLAWMGTTFESLNEISLVLTNDPDNSVKLVEMLKSGYLSWVIEKKFGKDYSDLKVIKQLEKLAHFDKTIAFSQMYYSFSSDEKIKVYEGARSISDVTKLIFKNPKQLYKSSKQWNNNSLLLGFLCHLGYTDHVMNYKNRTKNVSGFYNQLRVFYEFFEEVNVDKVFVRKAFIEYGPYAYLYWIQENINLYEFQGDEANRIKKLLMSNVVDSSMSISSMVLVYEKLIEVYKDFIRLFENNILLFQIGVISDGKSISSKFTDAYLRAFYEGVRIPSGFANKMEFD